MAGRIALSLLLAMTIVLAPASLSARPCILINAPSEKACDMGCCANKTCCETSPKNTSSPSQPLAKSGSHQQINLISPSNFVVTTLHQGSIELPIFSSQEWTAHSPAPLALICIRLI